MIAIRPLDWRHRRAMVDTRRPDHHSWSSWLQCLSNLCAAALLLHRRSTRPVSDSGSAWPYGLDAWRMSGLGIDDFVQHLGYISVLSTSAIVALVA